jgi:hypothetical protein
VIHLYAVSALAPDPPDVRGIDGAPLRHPACGALHATVSDHPRAPAPSVESATSHAAVIAAVAEQVPTVPIRFGVDHTDAVSLRRSLSEVEDTLLRTLERVGDAVEFVLRAGASPPTTTPVAIPDDGTDARGRTYLEDRLRAQQEARATEERRRTALATAAAPLAEHAIETTDRVGRAGPERCFLVARAQARRFAEVAAEVLADRDELLLGGPWPPYTFAGDVAAS